MIVKLLKKLPDPRTRDGIKSYARFIVARSTSITIVTLVNQNVDTEDLATHNKVGVVVGAHVLGEMVADATKPFVDRQIDEAAETLAAFKQAAAEAQEEPIKVEATRE